MFENSFLLSYHQNTKHAYICITPEHAYFVVFYMYLCIILMSTIYFVCKYDLWKANLEGCYMGLSIHAVRIHRREALLNFGLFSLCKISMRVFAKQGKFKFYFKFKRFKVRCTTKIKYSLHFTVYSLILLPFYKNKI